MIKKDFLEFYESYVIPFTRENLSVELFGVCNINEKEKIYQFDVYEFYGECIATYDVKDGKILEDEEDKILDGLVPFCDEDVLQCEELGYFDVIERHLDKIFQELKARYES